jgi:hypothetical protein
MVTAAVGGGVPFAFLAGDEVYDQVTNRDVVPD